ncbi:hypothetical protein [Marinilactibacillus kalidii]|uniref:hypothetical protein n=1 Tax=Marinilactibacillus kalidii TaxID=2820274 RepID=UPI001ABE0D3B|nr:hypothetical protein [Marinilactibacillus kalidii]
MKKLKIANFILVTSVVTLIIGYCLWAVLIPMQDANEINREDIIRLQQEVAFNYPLGRFLLYVGFIGIGVSFVFYGKHLYVKLRDLRS